MGKPLYPRGFVSWYHDDTASGQVYDRRDGDEEVIKLYTDHVRQHQPTNTWEFRKQVIACAIRLFGGIQRWADIQLLNKHLHGTNYAFFLDTINFINTGKRQVSVQNWLDLLEVKPDADEEFRTREIDPSVKDFMSAKRFTPEVISMWCGHENGFEDLLSSLYCMFGD